jgi:hypothetical protein
VGVQEPSSKRGRIAKGNHKLVEEDYCSIDLRKKSYVQSEREVCAGHDEGAPRIRVAVIVVVVVVAIAGAAAPGFLELFAIAISNKTNNI